MDKFILKTSMFVLPFFILFTLNVIFYDQKEGDLARLGYLYSNPTPKTSITSQYDLPNRYKLLSEIDLKTKQYFKVITIGDSFSEQGSLGYGNFLALKDVPVLHIDGFITGENPTQTLIQLLNSDFFDYISADFIVLQSVERFFNKRNKNIDFDKVINTNSISNKIKNHSEWIPNYNLPFFSDTTFKILTNNIQYFFDLKLQYYKTYRYKLNSTRLFSNEVDRILVYQDDINKLYTKNNYLDIVKSVKVMARIDDLTSKHSMKLIVLVSPDKYDLYFPFIENDDALIEPTFFEIYGQIEKKYVNVDSYKILSENIINTRDIYFYDDTHWSPKGAEIIANELYSIIIERAQKQ